MERSCMTPHDRARELLALAHNDLYAARVLLPDARVAASMIGSHFQQTVEKRLKQ